MGHRALVAYRRPDHLYDLRYSHWGGADLALVDQLSAETPLARGRVDSELLADTVALERILTGYLDPCVHEALYLVSGSYDVRASRVLWLAWDDGRESGRGAVVGTEPGDRDLEVRTWFRATKTALADVVEMGVLSRRAARSYLEARVCEDRDGRPYSYDPDDGPDEGPQSDESGGSGENSAPDRSDGDRWPADGPSDGCWPADGSGGDEWPGDEWIDPRSSSEEGSGSDAEDDG